MILELFGRWNVTDILNIHPINEFNYNKLLHSWSTLNKNHVIAGTYPGCITAKWNLTSEHSCKLAITAAHYSWIIRKNEYINTFIHIAIVTARFFTLPDDRSLQYGFIQVSGTASVKGILLHRFPLQILPLFTWWRHTFYGIGNR